MKFIKEHHSDIAKRAIILQPAQQDAFSHKTNPRAKAGLVVKADLIAHLCTQHTVAFPGHPGSDGAGGHAARLENNDLLVSGQSRVQQHLGDLCSFARTRGRHQNQAIAGLHGAGDCLVDLPDGQRSLRHRTAKANRISKRECGAGPGRPQSESASIRWA